ncbi:organic cation transporter protein isoform X1 [Patella vulgata]|uniref:organic cation transporter protein isoform X1 n=1 Tax=Patella vulgata TaxID=6465 RepID=UPI00218010FC|nr:organic cation transporter protein isoform X1 [Patella vulgata]XP_050392936.1 organic cation transporter protein isoform X1 [Patella vulgata]
MHFDEILRHLGEFGTYQKRVFFLLCLPAITHGIRMCVTVFLQFVPKHRCAIPGYENDTYAVQSEYHQKLINETIPLASKGLGWLYDQCHLYDYTSSNHSRSTLSCSKWVYDQSVFLNTASSELNLVCDDALKTSHAQMIFMGGYFFGAFATGAFSDKFGRKISLYASIVLVLAGGLGLAWAQNFITFVIIRFINGIGTAGVFTTCFVLGVEIVGPSKRAWTGIVIEYFFAIGMVLYAGMGYFIRDWHYLEITASIPVVLFLGYWWLIPESPRWLINEGRTDEAEVIIRHAAKVNKVKLQDKIFIMETEDQKEDKKPKANIFQLFTHRVLAVRTIIIFFNWMVVSMVYFGLSLNSDNLGAGSLFLNFFLVGLVEFPAYTVCILLLDRVGRKVLHVGSMIVGGVACGITIITILYAGDENQWLTVLFAMLGKVGATMGFAIIYVFSSELFPTVVRQAGMGFSSSFARLGGMISPYVVDAGKIVGGDFGRALPMIVFGALSVGAGLLTLYLPETHNTDLPESIEDGKRFGRIPNVEILISDDKNKRNRTNFTLVPKSSKEYNDTLENAGEEAANKLL